MHPPRKYSNEPRERRLRPAGGLAFWWPIFEFLPLTSDRAACLPLSPVFLPTDERRWAGQCGHGCWTERTARSHASVFFFKNKLALLVCINERDGGCFLRQSETIGRWNWRGGLEMCRIPADSIPSWWLGTTLFRCSHWISLNLNIKFNWIYLTETLLYSNSAVLDDVLNLSLSCVT